MLDTPTIASSAYATTTHNISALSVTNISNTPKNWFGKQLDDISDIKLQAMLANSQQVKNHGEKVMAVQRRLVKVVIVDTDENVPLTDCVLYSGEEKLTDATDQELFFEIDIKNILEAHNAKRIQLIDKKVKERTEHLEPAKIRDLKMVVVNIAQF